MKKDKICACKGKDDTCSICKGTGIILYDEDYDNIHDLFGNDDVYYEEQEDDDG